MQFQSSTKNQTHGNQGTSPIGAKGSADFSNVPIDKLGPGFPGSSQTQPCTRCSGTGEWEHVCDIDQYGLTLFLSSIVSSRLMLLSAETFGLISQFLVYYFTDFEYDGHDSRPAGGN